ncbi:aspartyl-phosphate phosphatase Spo0E family protein [Neobacillus cucumis]|uniref:aspartyl-phosphate phosphatase Spo0E family protein n=1 Tax=Neobacillus cucumis TaxID=1740721 RepID=UPI0019657723|nr:aspartyl-phosphate phosphatase Spo0E family protein [Neobacillus cucumis]MBM7654186.1 stage 0 sporulation regulatory protein [Neobacillus cucumis]
MNKDSDLQSEMIEEIKAKRELMINSANSLGYTSPQTIKYSQELDELINHYHKVIGQNSKSTEEVKIAFKHMVMV